MFNSLVSIGSKKTACGILFVRRFIWMALLNNIKQKVLDTVLQLQCALPASRACGKGHDSIIGLISGMVVMAVSLLMMG